MSDDDVTQRAARIINESNWKADFKGGARADEIAQALSDAGLLVSPKHDAAVAAKALRDAADRLNRDRRNHDASCGDSPAQTDEQAGRDQGETAGLRHAVRHLNERAEYVERKAGESDE